MKKQFNLGQVVKFNNYKRSKEEKEAYFVVYRAADHTNELAIYTINSNRSYPSGAILIPDFPEEDLQIVDLTPGELINQEINIKENVEGVAVYFEGDNKSIQFTHVGNYLISNVAFEIISTNKHRLTGYIHIDLSILLR